MWQPLLRRYSNKFLSRWVVLSIDMGFVLISFLLANFLRFNFEWSQMNVVGINAQLFVVMAAFFAGFVLFQPFAGIIRHTSSKDLENILLASLTGMGFVFLFNGVLEARSYNGIFRVPFSTLLIHFVLVVFLMATSRFFIRSFFRIITHRGNKTYAVLIYGAGRSGIATKHSLDQESRIKYQVVAFLDDNSSLQGKAIEGIPVMAPLSINQSFIDRYGVQDIIIAIQDIAKEDKKQLLDNLLGLKVSVKEIPPVSQWIDGQFSARQIHAIQIEDLLGRDPIQIDNEQVASYLTDKVILITGAAGSIGSELVRQVSGFMPKKLILVDQAESPLHDLLISLGYSYDRPGNIAAYVTSINHVGRMREIMETHRPEVIFHAAAYKHVPMMELQPDVAMETNILGSRILCQLANQYGAKRFVQVSTDKAVNPTNIMGATKRVAEMYAQAMAQVTGNDTLFITTRFGNVLGSSGSVIPHFQRQIEQGGPVTVTHPEVTRYFMTIPEACSLVLQAGSMGQGGDIFVFDMGQPVRIYDLAKKMIRLSGKEVGVDIDIQFTGLRPGEKLYEEVLSDHEKTMPTYHPKIRIAGVRTLSLRDLEADISVCRSLADKKDLPALVAQLKAMIPEYKPDSRWVDGEGQLSEKVAAD